ncbi:hypothetical protein K1M91_16510 [Motilimonas sp. E26]|nr:hypothetical protein [Motilimonas sp. E26]
MKVWFFSVNRVSDRDYYRYGLYELSLLGVKVIVVDVSTLIWCESDELIKNQVPIDIIYCNTITDFESLRFSISKSDFIICGGVLPPTFHKKIFDFTKNIGLQTLGAMPLITNTESNFFSSKLLPVLKRKKIVKKIISKIYGRYLYKKLPYYFVMRSGVLSDKAYPGIDEKTKVIECQSYDIYLYLLMNSERLSTETSGDNKEKYILWIDQAIPYHTDTLKCNGDISNNDEKYFERIKSLLIKASISYNCKVKISMHPRMIGYKKYQNVWEGWEVFLGETIDAIRGALICMTHNSTAIHAVAHFKTPLILVEDPLLTDNGYDNGLTKTFSEELGCPCISTSTPFTFSQSDFEINPKKYNAYIDNYVTHMPSLKPLNAINMIEFMKNGGRE